MKRIYGKTTMDIMREFVEQKKQEGSDIIERKDIFIFFKSKYPDIKKVTTMACITRGTINHNSRHHYHPKTEDDLFQGLGKGKLQIVANSNTNNHDGYDIDNDTLEDEEAREFAYERDLQAFLARNLDIIEPGLELFTDEENEDVNGFEFPAGGRYIDILAKSKTNDLVVIELKVSKAYDRVVGQLMRYMAWIKENIAEDDQNVRGVIISKTISEDLVLATSMVQDVILFEYELNVTLKKI